MLEADAEVIALSRWNPFYYELGIHMMTLSDLDGDKIADSLLQTFQTRLQLLMDCTYNSELALAYELPRLERDLFLSGRRAKMRLLEWLKAGTGRILPSEYSVHLERRKRINYMATTRVEN